LYKLELKGYEDDERLETIDDDDYYNPGNFEDDDDDSMGDLGNDMQVKSDKT
jgi:hypothetical protein